MDRGIDSLEEFTLCIIMDIEASNALREASCAHHHSHRNDNVLLTM